MGHGYTKLNPYSISPQLKELDKVALTNDKWKMIIGMIECIFSNNEACKLFWYIDRYIIGRNLNGRLRRSKWILVSGLCFSSTFLHNVNVTQFLLDKLISNCTISTIISQVLFVFSPFLSQPFQKPARFDHLLP